MSASSKPWKKARSGKVNRFYVGGTYSFLIELDDIDPAVNDDEGILESSDGEYKKTLKVSGDGTMIDDTFIHLMFPGVTPGKKYTLTYDLKKDADGNDLGKIVMFHEMLIEQTDLDDPKPAEERDLPEDDDDFPAWDAQTYSAELAGLYEDPDPDADEDSVLESEQATENDPEEDISRFDDYEEEER